MEAPEAQTGVVVVSSCGEEKVLTMRGTDVKMVLCLDTLGPGALEACR